MENIPEASLSAYSLVKWKPLLDVDFEVSHYCCNVMKKNPVHTYQRQTGKKGITAMMADESRLRLQKWMKQGCNAFEAKNPQSMPMAFWKENDVLEYIDRFHIPICSVYGDVVQDMFSQVNLFGEDSVPIYRTTGCQRTGCVFCGFGCHLEKGESRFQRLKRTHPKQWKYCIEGGAYDDDGLWKPNKDGLGMRHVFETLNSIYGESFIRFE